LGQIGKTWNQADRKVVHAVVAQIFKRLQCGGLPRAGHAGNYDQLGSALALPGFYASPALGFPRSGHRGILPCRDLWFLSGGEGAGNTLLHDLLKNVNSEDSLLVFIAALVKDRQDAVVAEKENPSSTYGPVAGGWENTSIESFLEAAAAWAESTHFGLTQGLPPDNPWRRFASFLYCGKIYE